MAERRSVKRSVARTAGDGQQLGASKPDPAIVRTGAVAGFLDAAGVTAEARRQRPLQPRPMNGILVAITVMNWTLASSGRLAM